MSSALRRAGSKVMNMIVQTSDPSKEAERALLYTKLVDGVAQWFVRSSGGRIEQLTGPNAMLRIGYLRGLRLSYVSASVVEVAPGRARDVNDLGDITLDAAAQCDITVSGFGGLDTGAEAASTWYAVWLISDSTEANPTGLVFSASFTSPTFPIGYDRARRIGAVRNSSGSDFLRFFQRGADAVRRITYDEARATLQVVTNGQSTANPVIDISTRVPQAPASIRWGGILLAIEMLAPLAGALDTNELGIASAGGSLARTLNRVGILSATSWKWMLDYFSLNTTTTPPSFTYAVRDADDIANIYIVGYDDLL